MDTQPNKSEQDWDPLISYHRTSPVLLWTKRLGLLLLFSLVFGSIGFTWWWNGLSYQERTGYASDYPALEILDRAVLAGFREPENTLPVGPSEQPEPAEANTEPAPTVAKKADPEPAGPDAEDRHIAQLEAQYLKKEKERQAKQAKYDRDMDLYNKMKAEHERNLAQAKLRMRERLALEDKTLKQGGLPITLKVWSSDTPLTWDDFRNPGAGAGGKEWGAYVASSISYEMNERGHLVYARMDCERSWSNPEHISDYGLAHEQLHFDITELYARTLRSRLDGIHREDYTNGARFYDQVKKDWRKAQHNYDQETVHGKNKEKQAEWARDVKAALNQMATWEWIPKWKANANKDLQSAQEYLAIAYANGSDGFPQSDELAKNWMFRAAQNGSPIANNNLGVWHLRGHILKQSDRKAFKRFQNAAEYSNPVAQFNLGLMYWKGLGVQQSQEKALEAFTKASSHFSLAETAVVKLPEAN